MYIPKPFAITDADEIHQFIHANAFGQLISQAQGQLCASSIPFLMSQDRQYISGHLAKLNPQSDSIDGQDILITLQGPHDYISPSWYTKPGVPTWNYQAVHIYGRCQVFDSSDKLKTLLEHLTQKYEADSETPWHGEYPETMLSAIVGFDIVISDIQCKYKLSQNRPVEDRESVSKQLQTKGSTALVEAMRKVETCPDR